MQKKIPLIVGVIALLLIVAGALWFDLRPAPITPYDLQLAEGEQITEWGFEGAYTGSAELETKAQTETKRLEALIGSGEYPDYVLYVSIANQYDLLGDGANELKYLKYALGIDATSTGLAWNNAGALFVRLGAKATARMCYERAAAAQPIGQYLQALADFLKKQYPEDIVAIKAAEEAVAGATELLQ